MYSYATWWIRQSIEQAIMSQTRTIRLPIHVMKELHIYLRTARELTQSLDHRPTVDEIAEAADKPVASVRRMFSLYERVTSIDTPLVNNSNKMLLDTLPEITSSDPETLLEEANISSNLEDWLDMLPQRDAEVLSRRFGLRGFEMSTFEEVGKATGLSQEQATQIQVEALYKLRVIVECNGLSGEDLLK